jgi:hypothetical protein
VAKNWGADGIFFATANRRIIRHRMKASKMGKVPKMDSRANRSKEPMPRVKRLKIGSGVELVGGPVTKATRGHEILQ